MESLIAGEMLQTDELLGTSESLMPGEILGSGDQDRESLSTAGILDSSRAIVPQRLSAVRISD
jgi:hypothetical protein